MSKTDHSHSALSVKAVLKDTPIFRFGFNCGNFVVAARRPRVKSGLRKRSNDQNGNPSADNDYREGSFPVRADSNGSSVATSMVIPRGLIRHGSFNGGVDDVLFVSNFLVLGSHAELVDKLDHRDAGLHRKRLIVHESPLPMRPKSWCECETAQASNRHRCRR
jgi:hypothetical protein